MNFNSHSDLAVIAAVNLVNAFTPGERRGRIYEPPEGDAAAAAAGEALGFPRHDVTVAEAAELAALATELREVFDAVATGDIDAAAHQVNRLLTETEARPRLEHHDSEPWHLHFHAPGGTFTGNWAASCATGLAIVLGSDLYQRLGVCTAPHCDRVYVDVSRNGQRRFCSTTCQNRVKAAAFRARAATTA